MPSARSLSTSHGTARFRHGSKYLTKAFVQHVGELAEAANHHPDIDIRYNKVTLVLSNHDAGGLREKDFDLAKAIDAR